MPLGGRGGRPPPSPLAPLDQEGDTASARMPEREAFPLHLPPAPTALPLNFPSAFGAFHAPVGPIPVDQRTHEGRYIWDPALAARALPGFHPHG